MKAVVDPISRGMHRAWSASDVSEKLVSKVLDAVPIERVKRAVKEHLYPQYEAACRSIAPSMESYGTVAGTKLVGMLKVCLP